MKAVATSGTCSLPVEKTTAIFLLITGSHGKGCVKQSFGAPAGTEGRGYEGTRVRGYEDNYIRDILCCEVALFNAAIPSEFDPDQFPETANSP